MSNGRKVPQEKTEVPLSEKEGMQDHKCPLHGVRTKPSQMSQVPWDHGLEGLA